MSLKMDDDIANQDRVLWSRVHVQVLSKINTLTFPQGFAFKLHKQSEAGGVLTAQVIRVIIVIIASTLHDCLSFCFDSLTGPDI